MKFKSDQEVFWAKEYSKEYIEKNNQFDDVKGAEAWSKILQCTNHEISNFLELGCNIGRNINTLQTVLPLAKPSVIEISEEAFQYVNSKYTFENSFHGSILDSDFPKNSFDLTFTIGVLIHINPDQLLEHMQKLYDYSNNFIVIGEYFNRTPVTIEYQGQKDRLFKRDFGKLFIENFPVTLCDYGFLWGHIYDNAGFDDTTWWVFKK
jgi:pseudaminic acid biosynthesis-associated methylase